MNLIIDIGNTRAKLAIFDQDKMLETEYSDNATLGGFEDFVGRFPIQRAMLSRVGKLGDVALEKLKDLPFPLVELDAHTPLPVRLQWRQLGAQAAQPLPESMGADRIAALVGALALWPAEPLLIVDAGTCVTYEFIDDEGYYLGGNIAPGVEMRLRAMHEQTALLPLVSATGDLPPVGYDTPTCMRCGALRGLEYEVEGYIRCWRQRYPALRTVLAGGTPLHIEEPVIQEKNLVLIGLNATLNSLPR
ncbi:MAG: type III pantothenate kinase [Bacteroidales bacterium]|nr:type III pantothenate kinase [Candidatus Physcousia equi]